MASIGNMTWEACKNCKYLNKEEGCTLEYTKWLDNLDFTQIVSCGSYKHK